MNGRYVPDLLTGLQDALNVAHDNYSPSRPSRVLRRVRKKKGPLAFRRGVSNG
jgi:hypothetical protein